MEQNKDFIEALATFHKTKKTPKQHFRSTLMIQMKLFIHLLNASRYGWIFKMFLMANVESF